LVDNSIQIGAGVGVPVGILFICALVLGAIFLARYVRRRKLQNMMSARASKFRDDEKAYEEMTDVEERARVAQEALRQWEIPKKDVEFGKEIGAGAFGKVYVGTYNNKKVCKIHKK